jgi:hypothetical protein
VSGLSEQFRAHRLAWRGGSDGDFDEHMAAFVAARVAAAREERDAAWRITIGNFLRSDLERIDWAREALQGTLTYLTAAADIRKGDDRG